MGNVVNREWLRILAWIAGGGTAGAATLSMPQEGEAAAVKGLAQAYANAVKARAGGHMRLGTLPDTVFEAAQRRDKKIKNNDVFMSIHAGKNREVLEEMTPLEVGRHLENMLNNPDTLVLPNFPESLSEAKGLLYRNDGKMVISPFMSGKQGDIILKTLFEPQYKKKEFIDSYLGGRDASISGLRNEVSSSAQPQLSVVRQESRPYGEASIEEYSPQNKFKGLVPPLTGAFALGLPGETWASGSTDWSAPTGQPVQSGQSGQPASFGSSGLPSFFDLFDSANADYSPPAWFREHPVLGKLDFSNMFLNSTAKAPQAPHKILGPIESQPDRQQYAWGAQKTLFEPQSTKKEFIDSYLGGRLSSISGLRNEVSSSAQPQLSVVRQESRPYGEASIEEYSPQNKFQSGQPASFGSSGLPSFFDLFDSANADYSPPAWFREHPVLGKLDFSDMFLNSTAKAPQNMWNDMGLGKGAGKALGTGLRDVLTGMTSLPDMVMNPFLNSANALAGNSPDYFTSSGGALADMMGLPRRKKESLGGAVIQSVAGGLPLAPLGLAVQGAGKLGAAAKTFAHYKWPDFGADVGMGMLGGAIGGMGDIAPK